MLAPRLMQVKPNYIKSLLTSHDSAQTAFKDLAANAKDAGATAFMVDVDRICGVDVLITWDNGPGPVEADPDSPFVGTITLNSFMGPLFDLGGTTALGDGGKIGQYGIGAITGPLRIGRRVVVATRSADYLFCALLCSSLIEDQADGILLPYLVYDFAEREWHENAPGSYDFFDHYTAFGTDDGLDRYKLLEVCMKYLPTAGQLLHVISDLADEIEVGQRGDIAVPKMAHAFDSSVSRYLAYAFYKTGNDADFKITIKGRDVSHLKDKGPFRETLLKLKRTLPPYKARDASKDALPIEADVVVGFTTKEGAGSLSTADELPMGLCISINGVMVTMFELLPKQAAGFRSHASVADKVRLHWHGLVVLVKLKLAHDKKLEEYGLLINQRKDGFQENKAFNKLKAAVLEKVEQQFVRNLDWARLLPPQQPMLLLGAPPGGGSGGGRGGGGARRFGSSEEAVRHVTSAKCKWPRSRPPALGHSSASYKKASLAILGLSEPWTELDAKKAFRSLSLLLHPDKSTAPKPASIR